MNWVRRKKNRWGFKAIAIVLIAAIMFTLPVVALSSSEQPTPPEEMDLHGATEANDTATSYLPGQIIVKYRDGISKQSKSGINAKIAGIAAQVASNGDISLLEMDKDANITEVLEDLNKDPDILFAEPNYIARALEVVPYVPNDPEILEQWALEMIDAPEAWQIPELQSTSHQVNIAVLDTGVDLDHPDLINRILVGKNFTNYKDDGTPYLENDYNDDEGHGTQVSGIIAAECNNAIGISGVAGPSNLKILPVKVLNDYGEGTVFDIAEGIRWAADQSGVSVINLSLGMEYYSRTLADSIEYAQNRGILVIAAAGNDNRPVTTMFPAAFPGVMAIGSIYDDGERIDWSNYGDGLDLMAPGWDILTTSWYKYNEDEEYASPSGTSMAAPHVAAVAGMYKLLYPEATSGEIASVLRNTATDMGDPGWDSMTGYGLLNAAAALIGETVEQETITFLSPGPSAKVTGKVTVTVEAMDAESVNKVVFYLDDSTDENNQLAEVIHSENETKTQYSFPWDSNLSDIPDGEHTLIAEAYFGDIPVGEPVSRSIILNNTVINGLLLQILDPNGGPAADAEVTIYEKKYDTYNEKTYYDDVYSGVVDGTGMLRIPAVFLADLKKYEVIVQGTFDPIESEEWIPYIYHRTYESPESDVIDGSLTMPINLSMKDLQNNTLDFAKYILALKDSEGNLIATGDSLHSYLDDPSVVYVESDSYDAYAFWSPTSAEGLASDYNMDNEYGENLYTYFLSKKDITLEDNMNLVLNTESAGKIVSVIQEGQGEINFGLENEMIDEILDYSVGQLSSNSGIVTTEGEYDLWSRLYQGPSTSSWSYSFSRSEPIFIPKNTTTEYRCGGDLTLTMTTETPEIKENNSFYTTVRFSDSFGNYLTSVYYYNAYPYSGMPSGYKYPTFQINDSLDQRVTAYGNTGCFTETYWYSPTPVGEYTANLLLLGSLVGPINNNQDLRATLNFQVVADDTASETIPIQVMGRSGQPISSGYIYIYEWETTYESEGEEYGYWKYFMYRSPDKQSNFNFPTDMQMDPDKTYVAVVVDYEGFSGTNTFGWKEISSLDDLKNISLANTRPVHLSATDKSGIVPEYVNIDFSLALNADSDDRIEYLGPFSGNGNLYVTPGDYQFSASFIDFNITNDQYLLISDKVSIIEDPEKNPVTLELKGQDVGQIALETTSGFNVNTINLYTDEGYYSYLEGMNPNTDINLYLTEGKYYGFAEMWQMDPEIKPSGPVASDYQNNSPYYVWKHYLEFGTAESFWVEKDMDTTWKFGGPFHVDLDLNKTALTLEDTLEGSSIVMDGFNNRQFYMETDEWWMGGEPVSIDYDGQFTYKENMSNRFYRLPDGRFVSVKNVEAKTWEDGAPFLRVYRQNGTGEERVFNQSSDDYYYGFEEDFSDWGTEGRYRAELAIGIGPEGPISTGTNEKYYFTIGNPEESPVITMPTNGKYFNSRTFTIEGLTLPNQGVEVYAYMDTVGTTPRAVIQADESGQFSGSVTVDQDGQWKVMAKLPNGEPSEILTVNIDTVAPHQPVISAALASDGKSVNINITGDSGESTVTALIYRDSSLIAEKYSDALYMDSSTKRGTTYTYQVAWEDQAGNRSNLSDPVTITIPEGLQSAFVTYEASSSGYAKLDQKITITGRGTSGMTGSAILTIQPSTGTESQSRTVDLIETEAGFYQGTFTLEEGMASVSKMDVSLDDSLPIDALKGKPILVGGTLSGTVSRTNIGTIADFQVNIYSKDGTYRDYITVNTDETGSYRVDGLTPGTYAISCYDPLSKQYYELDQLEVLAGTHLNNNPIMLPEYRNLTIAVVDKDDQSISIGDITVTLYNDKEYRTGTIGPDGILVFNNLPVGTYQWAVNGATSLEEPYQNGSGTLTIPSGEDTYTILLSSINNLTGIIHGKVTDNNDNPISGVTVDVWSWANYEARLFGGRGYSGKAVSDEDGNYTIPKLLPGTDYRMTFNHPDYLQKIVNGGTVILGESKDLGTQKLTLAGKAKGVVRGTDSQNNTLPLADIPIQLSNFSFIRTLGDGSYAFNSLAAGTKTITVNGRQIGYSTSSASITVEEGQTVTKDFDLKELGVIDGRVTDSQGNPIQYVYLTTSGPSGQTTRTDTDGRYYLRSLEAGEYTVHISSAPSQYVRQSKAATVIDLQRTEVNFALNTADELAQAFGGAGNSMSVNTVETAPGETLRYAASYTNNSLTPVENVQITLEIPDNTTLVTGVNGPALNGTSLNATVENQRFTVNIGTVAAGERGQIIYHVLVDSTINEEKELNVTGNISWNIGNESRSGALGTTQTSVLFSSIYAPGITSDGKIKVYGKTVPGSLIQVYDGETLLGTTTVNGRWWYMDVQLRAPEGGLEEETHHLVAVAIKDDNTSNASKSAQVVYRSDIPTIEDTLITAGWNKDISNNPHIGIVTMGVTELTPFNVQVKFQDNQTVEDVKFRWLDKDYTMVLNGDGYYEGNVPYGWQIYGEQMVHLHFKDTAGRAYEFPLALFIILIDPSGYVYEGVPSNRLAGVTATVQQKVGGIWQNWNAELFGQNNPQITDAEGRYGWDVPAGTWRVIFSKAGYETLNSETLWDGIVPPPKFDLNVNLKSDAMPAIVTRTPASNAVDVPIGSSINIEFSKYMKLDTFTGNLTLKKESNGEVVSGALTGIAIENGLTKTVKFIPNQNLENSTVYRVNLTTGKDYTDKNVAADTWTFTTVAAQSQPGGGGGARPKPEEPKPEEPKLEIPPILPEGERPDIDEFTDMSATDWFYDSVQYVLDRGLFKGVSDNEFAPEQKMTRSMLVTVLYRLAGTPEVAGESFGDIQADSWYENAVIWAAQNGIVGGYADGLFRPNDDITREQMAAILYRFALHFGQDVDSSDGGADITAFADRGAISSWAEDSLKWMVSNEILKGKLGNMLDPAGNASRAEIATILQRWLESL